MPRNASYGRTFDYIVENSTPEPNTGCWLWLGGATCGYGVCRLNGKDVPAHCASWELAGLSPTNGQFIRHRCNTRCCVNPDHLFLGNHPTEDRFWSKVRKTESCWIWTACRSRNGEGYGMVWVHAEGKKMLAHRISYEMNVGSIPDGLKVLHSCDNPACVRPDHLFLGTQLDNMRDMYAKGRAPRHRRRKAAEAVTC